MASVQPTIDSASAVIPRHVAIIMDGNGRWASAHHLPRAMGHRRGAEAVRRAVKGCISEGVSVLTLYAFSSENWKRPADEVEDLMGLLRLYLRREIDDLHKNDVRLRFMGDVSKLSPDLQKMISRAETLTAQNQTLTLVIALNYGSQSEIVAACQTLAAKVAKGELAPDDITDDLLASHLQLSDLPHPDLVIRTSGERRLSNFLLWQSAYAELLFLDVLWPDFNEQTLKGAIADYQRRERRFGGR
ncbi:isoprenyl transferase [Iodidimonas gelatinilytica]|uniref:Isoprenyl transferase n=1 Tax=Iodidimonas gelatinilytica TaxID=1236966 RepID=A0A5A7N0F7_9PROT|nr:isoprenyl transferase [Iodidimonas gelatinilytica]GEQ96840.1 isoprenyl transferase [Iodidimonas gelatinilytica]GER01165.1 isoprenyl transferase [Iodidimonas gelatinilytica]